MGLPLSIVDNVSFKNFMNDVDAKYQSINRRDTTRTFLPMLKQKCVSRLQEICGQSNYVSLTLDAWTDRRIRSYIGITLHTIVDDKFKSFLLSFEQLEGKHTADKLVAEIDRAIQLFGLSDKVVRLITDNASCNRSAFDDLVLPGFEEYLEDIIYDQSETESTDEEGDY